MVNVVIVLPRNHYVILALVDAILHIIARSLAMISILSQGSHRAGQYTAHYCPGADCDLLGFHHVGERYVFVPHICHQRSCRCEHGRLQRIPHCGHQRRMQLYVPMGTASHPSVCIWKFEGWSASPPMCFQNENIVPGDYTTWMRLNRAWCPIGFTWVLLEPFEPLQKALQWVENDMPQQPIRFGLICAIHGVLDQLPMPKSSTFR